MAVWVTFYYGMMVGIRDYKEHKNKEEAEKYFRATYRNYFSLDTGLRGFKPPYSYGYPHRKYCLTTMLLILAWVRQICLANLQERPK